MSQPPIFNASFGLISKVPPSQRGVFTIESGFLFIRVSLHTITQVGREFRKTLVCLPSWYRASLESKDISVKLGLETPKAQSLWETFCTVQWSSGPQALVPQLSLTVLCSVLMAFCRTHTIY